MSIRSLFRSLTPDGLRFRVHHWIKNTSSFTAIGAKSSQVANSFDKLREIKGWFTLDDCSHFHLVLEMQKMNDVHGDLLEIGSYHGRSTAMMATQLAEDEVIHVCDAFEGDTADRYENKPTPETLMDNVRKLTPDLLDSQIVIHQCLSDELKLPANKKFRFVHIDGGHSSEQVYRDMQLACDHLQPRGVIVIDDYYHPQWPGVGEGVDRFLKDHPGLEVLGDMNRHGALGRKLYLYDAAG